MCIISGEVNKVSNTRILVAPLNKGKRQLTVYSNQVNIDNPVAMILPFPQSNTEFRFFDLTNYTDLFKDLNRLVFPIPLSRGFLNNSSRSKSLNNSLTVVQVGSYKASVAENVDDLDRINTSVFKFEPLALEFLKTNYSQGFGFVIAQMDQSKNYHPFGYIHGMLSNGRMFIPTMHFHQENHQNKFKQEPFFPKTSGLRLPSGFPSIVNQSYNIQPSNDQPSNDQPDWDHEIYCWNSALSGKNPSNESHSVSNKDTNFENHIRREWLPESIDVPQFINGYKINNYHENHDLIAVNN